MGKKAVIICVTLLMSSLLLSCSGKNINQSSGKNGLNTASAAVNAGETDNKNNQDTKGNPLAQLTDGKMNGVEFGISANCMDVLKALGKPDDEGTDGGSYYYVYGKITYFSDSIDENKGSISAIAVRDNIDICGVKSGMKPSEIKKVLGKPFTEGEDEGGGWIVTYEIKKGLYISFFSEGENAPVKSALLAKKSEE